MPAQSHRSDPRILGRRTLARDHRRLAELLRPGMAVLDIGCGSGAITAGIAEAVGSGGTVVGIDRDEVLLAVARQQHGRLPNLRFEKGDATEVPFHSQFDIVNASRMLQWIAEPARAVAGMRQAAKPGGMVVALDYSHTRNQWQPDPPAAFQHFYRAFLAWRDHNGWDNRMADHLPDLFRSAGLQVVRSTPEDEVVERGAPDFDERAGLWREVMDSIGEAMTHAGFFAARELEAARAEYGSWVVSDLARQTLALCAVTGIRGPRQASA